MDTEIIMYRLNQHLAEMRNRHYYPIYLALQGSQNYSLNDEGSDIDTKAMIIPSLEDIVLLNKQVSTTLIMNNNEHCDIKDIRLMFNSFKKQNVNFLEILFTDYFWTDPKYEEDFLMLRAMAEDIARYNVVAAVDCISGMAWNKYLDLEYETPTTQADIRKYGYCPKQLYHVVRLREILERYLNGELYKDCLHTNHREYLLKIKRGEFKLEDAQAIGSAEINKIMLIKEKFQSRATYASRQDVSDRMNKILMNIFKKSLEK